MASFTGGASSPYAPTRRNSYMRRSSSSSMSASASAAAASGSSSPTTTTTTTVVALFLLVVKYWRRAYENRHSIQKQISHCINKLFRLHMRLPSFPSLPPPPPPGASVVSGNVREMLLPSFIFRNGNTATATTTATTTKRLDVSSPSPSPTTTTTNPRLQRIQENQRLIRQVLDYWFGQYPPERSQKMLWMIGNSSKEHRRQVDSEIATKFLPLLLELAGDVQAGEEGEDLSEPEQSSSSTSRHSNRWTEWCLDPHSIYGVHGKVAAIIVLDQFSRHIQRHYDDGVVNAAKDGSSSSSSSAKSQSQSQSPSPSPLPTKAVLDQQALKTAKLLFEHPTTTSTARNVPTRETDSSSSSRSSPTSSTTSTHFEKIQSMIPLPMTIFALMPYRHASTIESVSYVQRFVESCSSRQEQLDDMLSRFRKATNRRMALLQDEQRRTGGKQQQEELQEQQTNEEGTPTTVSTTETETAAATTSTPTSEEKIDTQFMDEDILETFAFETDMTPSLKHPIHKTIADFLISRGIHPSTSKQSQPSASVIVSLSGGVDSMVIASVLSYLQKSCGYSHLSIWAVHIDYANRPESSAEADFVRRYCQGTLQNVHFICRRIDEVTRGITARDEYERIAREIRYNSYRETVAAAKREMSSSPSSSTSSSHDDEPVVGVMLGHHRGDLRENVLSNAHKGCGPLDLSGMTAVSKNDGIVIYRPLLPLEKSFVLDYAHKFGVPYFLDTTPSWSTRGKLRNKLLPLLEEIYGDGSMNNLSNLAVESDECRALLQESMIAPFMTAIVQTPMGIIMETAPWKDEAFFFWKFVLREALHTAAGLGMFSDKSVVSFLERVQAKKVKEGWLQCRKDYGVYLQADGKVFVFYPSSFPWNMKRSYDIMGQKVDVGATRDVGPWTVKTELVASGTPYIETLLSKKAVPNMETLMQGRIDYYLECPCIYDAANSDQCRVTKPLVFREFRRTDRPVAWKSADLRVQSTLPILGIQSSDHGDEVVDKDEPLNESESEGTEVVRVSLYLRNPN